MLLLTNLKRRMVGRMDQL